MGLRNVLFQLFGTILGALAAEGYTEEQVLATVHEFWKVVPGLGPIEVLEVLQKMQRGEGEDYSKWLKPFDE